MDFFSIFAIAIGLSMDALAVSITIGITTNQLHPRHALKTGLFFGGFQALMPLIGWLGGRTISQYITAFGHWLAFILLALVGGKMIWDAIKGGEEQTVNPTQTSRLLILALATSIDAFAIGVSYAVLNVNILAAAAIIGITTFIICVLGVWLGKRLGHLFQRWAIVAGGLILIAIGIKTLVEKLFI